MMEIDMTHSEYCNSLVDEMIQSNDQLALYEREMSTRAAIGRDCRYRAAVRVLYEAALINHESLMRRWGESLFEQAPVRFEDVEEEWTPDNAAFGDPGSRHHY
jgi:hypothetical protein